ncbi:response regulator transcription factor [Sulfurisoma sediminicola]|uniref:LuxR family two component transcriptional regulator n=1 Tax=Sulfurisoma sediminicola TaxID=1381557 RepID=A0A497XAY9_9PROT|nr:response regulator [Sulfurisoma sediminicola]RLJ62887.1 LuxR family two component transcriptional regulator [Sulfurisoma sediminicola]
MSTSLAYLVDDDEAIRDALAWLLNSRGIASRAWSSAESFLGDYDFSMRGCMVLDIRMPGMGGPELFDRLLEIGCRLPAIFLTGHGDVPLAVQAIKKGAFEFIEKPFNDNELVDRVLAAFQLDNDQQRLDAGAELTAVKLSTLSSREREVMELILAGKYNKVIADELGIAMRTVEVHRARIFEKMGVKSAVELAQLLAASR